MPSTKFEQILHSLDGRERKQVEKWLIYQKSEDHEWVRFFRLMLKVGKTEDEEIWKKLHPGKPYVATTYRSIRNRVMESVETWLSFQRFEEDRLQRDLQVLWALESRLESEDFMKEFRKVRTRIKKEPLSRESLRIEYQLVLLLLHHYTRQDHPLARRISKEMEQSFDNWILSEKLIQKLTKVNLKEPSNTWVPSPLTEAAFAHAGQQDPAIQPLLVHLYYKCCLLRMGELKQKEVADLQLTIKKRAADLRPDMTRDLFAIVFNYLNSLIGNGALDAWEQFYEWQKWGVESGAILLNGKVGPNFYRTLIKSACKAGKPEDAWRFLEELRDSLISDNPDEDYAYAEILIHFYEGRYDLIPSPEDLKEFRNPDYKYGTRLLGLISLYEQVANGAKPELDRDSLLGPVIYVRDRLRAEKDQIWPLHHVVRWQNFLVAFQRLCKAYLPEEWESLKQDIEKEKLISHPDWLMAKVKEGPHRWS